MKSCDDTLILAASQIKKFFGLKNLAYQADFKISKWQITLLSPGELIKLKDFKFWTKKLEKQVRVNYVVRWMLGIPLHGSNDLRIYSWKNKYHVVAINEHHIDYELIEIPKTIMRKWFNESWDEFLEIFRSLIQIPLFELRNKLKEIILELSPENIWWPRYIMARINDNIE